MLSRILGMGETVTKTSKNACPNGAYITWGQRVIGEARRRWEQTIKQIVKPYSTS